MADSFLDKSGLSYLWSKIKQYFVEKETGKGLSTNDYTTAEKNKLSGISLPSDIDDRIRELKTPTDAEVDENCIVTFETLEVNKIKTLVINLAPEQDGSGDQSPSNPRPIHGWTGANINFVVWNQAVDISRLTTETINGVTFTVNSDGSITVNGTASDDARYPLVQIPSRRTASKFLYRGCPSGGSINTYYIGGRYIFNTVGRIDVGQGVLIDDSISLQYSDTISVIIKAGFTANNLTFIPQFYQLTKMFGERVADYIYSLGQTTGMLLFKQIFYKNYYAYAAGETKISVASVNNDNYPYAVVNWQDKAGTVYGGTLDVINGVLSVYMVMVDLGTLDWSYRSENEVFYVSLDDRKPQSQNEVTNVICEIYKTSSVRVLSSSLDNNNVCGRTDRKHIMIKDLRYSNASTFKTAMSGVMLAYELETPITYQLTPTEVWSLSRTNNIWATKYNSTISRPAAFSEIKYTGLITEDDISNEEATASVAGLMSAADKTKLDGIATGAEVNVQSDWDEDDTTSDSYILNKPFTTISKTVIADEVVDVEDCAGGKAVVKCIITKSPGTNGSNIVELIVAPLPSGASTIYGYRNYSPAIYGGTINLRTGEVIDTWTAVDAGSINWSLSSYSGDGKQIFVTDALNNRLWSTTVDDAVVMLNGYDFFKNGISSQAANMPDLSILCRTNHNYVYVRDDRYSTTDDFEAAMSGKMIAYALAEPTTRQFDPKNIEINKGGTRFMVNIYPGISDGSAEIEYITEPFQPIIDALS